LIVGEENMLGGKSASGVSPESISGADRHEKPAECRLRPPRQLSARYMNPEYDVLIIGGGPAGLSGALVLGRCGRRVLVCDDNRPRNARSHGVRGYLSRDGIAPADLLKVSREQLQHYPSVELRNVEVVDVNAVADGFEATLPDGVVVRSKKLLIATGLVDELPPIEGLRERWGDSVFPCPFCDGWEYRGRPMAVYGSEYNAACGFAQELLTWSQELTLLTDASDENLPHETERLRRLGIRVDRRRIAKLEGPGVELERIVFDDGSYLACNALFVMTRQHQRNGFAEKLGCRPDEEGTVPTTTLQHTRTRGVYAAGNASVGLQSAILAAAEGFKAAYAINEELIEDFVREKTGDLGMEPVCAVNTRRE
jgi:thioredoxin reductase